ncbi:hypothetical protein PV04_07649 [Phialophora macrospora]|uniref:NADAR domain-containing protein n=1 Tax=Phialophora macrospora TaxID=1851006 RepID=A0A0D2FEU9_9EURO|nr:hypothetical protein PV04_07649 [Phialophora macrospora]
MSPKHLEEQHRRMRNASRDPKPASTTTKAQNQPKESRNKGRHSRSLPAASPPGTARATQTKPPCSSSTSPARLHAEDDIPRFPNTKITHRHVLFWSGPLSNWHVGTSSNKKSTFSGRRALDLLLPRLDAEGIPHPSERALSTRLLARHDFNCGEQFMMACKGWLFERHRKSEPLTERMPDEHAETLCQKLTAFHARSSTSHLPDPDTEESDTLPRFRAAYFTILSVLRASDPKEQKALGRQCKGFDERIWTPASVHVVVCACIARAEVDPELRALYEFACRVIPRIGQSTRNNKHAETTRVDGNTGADPDSATARPGNEEAANEEEGGGGCGGPKRSNGDGEMTEIQVRKFVEGSPVDRVWGVGLKWDDPKCEEEGSWKGENRLGKCHDEAAGYIREKEVGKP